MIFFSQYPMLEYFDKAVLCGYFQISLSKCLFAKAEVSIRAPGSRRLRLQTSSIATFFLSSPVSFLPGTLYVKLFHFNCPEGFFLTN